MYPPTSAMPPQPGFPPQAYPAPVPGYPTYPGRPSAYSPPAVNGIPQPYAQAPYTYPQPYPSGPVRSLRLPSHLAIGGLAATAVYSVLLQVIGYSIYRTSYATYDDRNLLNIAFAGYGAVFLFTAVTFLVWLHRASANLWNTGHAMKWRPGWTIGAWLIPLANLVLPLLVFREVDRSAREHGPGLFSLWAVAWTIDIVLERASSSTINPYGGVGLISWISLPVAAVAAILLIRRITTDQTHLTQPH
ncbi:DUF4328 domain-containing protein [Actinoplanes sp. HUAS TT8]|uniref:DUF4328 domain-containing protein n=1 Tax=Actinoplanes sp. HUAS TT8 TaxID=3447453 RepID=UPI003F51F911